MSAGAVHWRRGPRAPQLQKRRAWPVVMGQSAVLEYSTRSPSSSASDTTARARKKGTHVEQPVVAQCRSFLLQPSVDVVLDELHSHRSAMSLRCCPAEGSARGKERSALATNEHTRTVAPFRVAADAHRIGPRAHRLRLCRARTHALGNRAYPTIVCGRSAVATSRRVGAQSAVVGN